MALAVVFAYLFLGPLEIKSPILFVDLDIRVVPNPFIATAISSLFINLVTATDCSMITILMTSLVPS